jgi:hypothetical protein
MRHHAISSVAVLFLPIRATLLALSCAPCLCRHASVDDVGAAAVRVAPVAFFGTFVDASSRHLERRRAVSADSCDFVGIVVCTLLLWSRQCR